MLSEEMLTPAAQNVVAFFGIVFPLPVMMISIIIIIIMVTIMNNKAKSMLIARSVVLAPVMM